MVLHLFIIKAPLRFKTLLVSFCTFCILFLSPKKRHHIVGGLIQIFNIPKVGWPYITFCCDGLNVKNIYSAFMIQYTILNISIVSVVQFIFLSIRLLVLHEDNHSRYTSILSIHHTFRYIIGFSHLLLLAFEIVGRQLK